MTAPAVRLAAATSNVVEKLLRGGVADLRPAPRLLIDAGPNRRVHRFTTPVGVDPGGPPVLLVPPLAAPPLCFDLRRGCSLAEHLVAGGRRTYLVDYGTVAFADRGLGVEHWVHDVLPKAIRAVSADAGGRDVHLVAWCLGGIFSLLTAADQDELPIASITTIAAPFDFTAIPLIAPLRPLVELTGGHLLTPFYRLLGGAPSYLVSQAFRLTRLDKEITRPIAMLRNLHDRDFLAQLEAVDHFMSNMAAYPGRTFGQLYHRFFRANDLAEGRIEINGRLVSLSRVRVPTLVVAGEHDTIAPKRAVRRLVGLLSGAPEVRFESAPGGHLGVLTGRAARATTWRHLDEFLDSRADPC
ncbi:poly(3-hydroxyalkanoate) synthetase [Saccharomonospora marina XMU15]|uniref:Poly(3-hydroxyalkanoate) synthetase n=1 Tax=Saccharomonospora marina XMU15 TaxID=882083 RepID=H5X8T1_9PSEU|nr:alpha/beta fold hydrolase [Saccharomonospora marina]EHR52506.1 poly(3-hydroxyalkanoate) synthetase [Saccharomonospora marina XMU15]